jgi:hypothetical protein
VRKFRVIFFMTRELWKANNDSGGIKKRIRLIIGVHARLCVRPGFSETHLGKPICPRKSNARTAQQKARDVNRVCSRPAIFERKKIQENADAIPDTRPN